MASRNFDGGVTPPPSRISRIAIGDILRRTARRLPDNEALIDSTRRMTYAQLDAFANKMAHYLISQGAKPGDRCAMMFGNSIELVVTLFAVHRAGLIWVPINLMLDDEDVEYTLTHAGVSHVVAEAALADHPNLGAVARKLALPMTIADQGLPCCADQPETEPEVDIDRDDIAAIIYTSGTTSKPKGAMHTHQSVYMTAMGDAVEWSLVREDGIPLQLPLFHCGAHVLLLSFILVGAKCVLLRGFDPAAVLHVIDEEKLSVVVGLPMMYAAMLDHPDMDKRSMKSLRFGLHTMAPMYETLMRRMIDRICPTFMLTSGQTEMYPITTMSRPEMQLKRFGNVWGEPTVMCDLAIMDHDGKLLPAGEIGELVHRGPNVMYGYYKNQEATDEARRFGWHHTGDVGRINEFGEFEFLDRTKDMIKSGGENVSSMQVEAHLLDCQGVQEAIAVGIPHAKWGEAVTAFVVMKPGLAQDPEPIMQELRKHLGGFQLPKRIVFVDEVPKTATGKLRKVELRLAFGDLYEDEVA
ncbi:class I adenylate-forming enzyme family protein [Sulfitobacter porphyrae]|uniref:Class I adenylate-forming enzyme family protein n=1 Tax=Sulfitobacter porphyrae TaxID=1246864 RepID=A0ABW2B8G3_9RHOB|nr:acyl-CoA synthetase [Sulfitobacter porphyrae]